ncbi:unnamed protein product [Caretta caretta]
MPRSLINTNPLHFVLHSSLKISKRVTKAGSQEREQLQGDSYKDRERSRVGVFPPLMDPEGTILSLLCAAVGPSLKVTAELFDFLLPAILTLPKPGLQISQRQ